MPHFVWRLFLVILLQCCSELYEGSSCDCSTALSLRSEKFFLRNLQTALLEVPKRPQNQSGKGLASARRSRCMDLSESSEDSLSTEILTPQFSIGDAEIDGNRKINENRRIYAPFSGNHPWIILDFPCFWLSWEHPEIHPYGFKLDTFVW